VRLLADANVEAVVVQRLRAEGHDVAYVRELAPRLLDPVVLALARRQRRILLTNDKDFAELTFLQRQAPAGILLIRLPRYRSWAKAERLLAVLAQGHPLERHLTVVQPAATRRRPYPDS